MSQVIYGQPPQEVEAQTTASQDFTRVDRVRDRQNENAAISSFRVASIWQRPATIRSICAHPVPSESA